MPRSPRASPRCRASRSIGAAPPARPPCRAPRPASGRRDRCPDARHLGPRTATRRRNRGGGDVRRWRNGIGNGHRGSGPVSCESMTIDELIDAARNGSTRAAGKLLSLVESPRRNEVLDALGATTPPRIVGITGPPGAGKSTTVGALVSAYREREMRVAVLAVDPSSPYSGGALLGDRIRMAAHINDPDV